MRISSQQERFSEEFKTEAVSQISERGRRVSDMAEYGWR